MQSPKTMLPAYFMKIRGPIYISSNLNRQDHPKFSLGGGGTPDQSQILTNMPFSIRKYDLQFYWGDG